MTQPQGNRLDSEGFHVTPPHPPGGPIVREEEDRLVLLFDDRFEQSAMYKSAPFKLVFTYTRLMMGFLLFQPNPRDILIIGLGGGSLSKYCYRYLPQTRITTVEISEQVIALRERFAIPADDRRFRIVRADGAEYLEPCLDDFDAILLDGFDTDGLPSQLCSPHFYHRCASALKNNGVLAANFLEGDWQVATCVDRLHQAFDGRVLSARCDRGYNRIVFALNQDRLPGPDALERRAFALEARHDVNFRLIASKIRSELRL